MGDKEITMKLQIQTREYYEWTDVREALNEKLGYNIEDVKGRYKIKPYDDTIPSQCFWTWLHENFDIFNGCFLSFDWWLEDYLQYEKADNPLEPWVEEILSALVELVDDKDICFSW